jgi:general secretion pathway protein G
MTITAIRISQRRVRAGFSLVEMIGVLAIIAILAVVIVPKVFSTIASSRITQAVGSVTSMKAAVTEFSGKYGTIPTTNASARIDDLLFAAGLIENRFTVKIGAQQTATSNAAATWTNNAGTWTSAGGASQNQLSHLICLNSNTNPPQTANGANYRLDGATDLPASSRVVSAVLVNIRASEALELSQRIDGDLFSAANTTTADAAGKVVYNTPNGAGLTTAYVYIVHQ